MLCGDQGVPASTLSQPIARAVLLEHTCRKAILLENPNLKTRKGEGPLCGACLASCSAGRNSQDKKSSPQSIHLLSGRGVLTARKNKCREISNSSNSWICWVSSSQHDWTHFHGTFITLRQFFSYPARICRNAKYRTLALVTTTNFVARPHVSGNTSNQQEKSKKHRVYKPGKFHNQFHSLLTILTVDQFLVRQRLNTQIVSGLPSLALRTEHCSCSIVKSHQHTVTGQKVETFPSGFLDHSHLSLAKGSASQHSQRAILPRATALENLCQSCDWPHPSTTNVAILGSGKIQENTLL